MTYIIAEPCLDVKDRSCMDVCPVDCIHEAKRILVIDPEECIDCAACEPECPVEAIFPEDALPEKWTAFVKINYAYGDGLDRVDQLVDELRGDDGTAGVREPRVPPPDTPSGSGEVQPVREPRVPPPDTPSGSDEVQPPGV